MPTRLGVVILAGAVALGTASASPQAVADEVVPQGAPAATGVAAHHVLTLLTGDVVRMTTLPGGKLSATLDSGTPSGGRFMFWEQPAGTYVVPVEAVPYLSSRQLDRELFNVTGLVAQGYHDQASPTIPLLLKNSPRLRSLPAVPPGAKPTVALESVGARAVSEAKSQARTFWEAIDDDNAADGVRLAGGLDRVWLDRKVHATLDESVPQIGAPAAWSAGYTGHGVKVAVLDTGYDPTHPDLAGRVGATANFTTEPDVVDHAGHGTHVAATVAGTGAASGGARKGVAPGADLMIGRVLDNEGFGQLSWSMEGMEWAASHGARVVNLSFGASLDPSNDPLSPVVNSLTAQYGTLFVAASGNDGGEGTILSPAVADEALTVGAVDKQGELAPFSTRGPRPVDGAVKPDLVAPGVDIVAARAAGTGLGRVLGRYYTSMQGTSMATPHVTGAAVLLAQQHPDWTARQLKAALISTAHPLRGLTPYQQGSGRVDVAAATTQRIRPSTGSIAFGSLGEGAPVSATVDYRNDSGHARTLSLSASMEGNGGQPDPISVTVSPSRLTVPAGGTATATVTLDPAGARTGPYRGTLVARADGDELRTNLGALVPVPERKLTLKMIPREGELGLASFAQMWNQDTGLFEAGAPDVNGERTFTLPEGRYSVAGFVESGDPLLNYIRPTAVTVPDVELTEDRTVVLDARPGNPVRITTREPTVSDGVTVAWHRKVNGRSIFAGVNYAEFTDVVYGAPSPRVSTGDFEFLTRWSLAAPTLRAAAAGVPLDPFHIFGAGYLDGRLTLDLVDAGAASPADLAGVDVRGRVALVRRAGFDYAEQIRAAGQAGAAAVFLYNDEPGQWIGSTFEDPTPAYTLSDAEGRQLLAALAAGPIRADLTAVAVSPYRYETVFAEPDRIPDRMDYDLRRARLATVDASYHAHTADASTFDHRSAFRPYTQFGIGATDHILPPVRRTEYVTTDDTLWVHDPIQYSWDFAGQMNTAPERMRPGQRRTETWFGAVTRPGLLGLPGTEQDGLPVTRFGDAIRVFVPEFVSADSTQYSRRIGRDLTQMELRSGGQVLGSVNDSVGQFAVPAGPRQYQLQLDTARDREWWSTSTATTTTWTFRSAHPRSGTAVLPLLQVDYRIPTDMRNTVRANLPRLLWLDATHQPGYSYGGRYSMKVALSTDDGQHWRDLPVLRTGSGRFAVITPALADLGTGFATLKVAAADRDGNAIEQTITRAYKLAH